MLHEYLSAKYLFMLSSQQVVFRKIDRTFFYFTDIIEYR